MATDNSYVNALVGAVVTVLLSFIPFAPLVGGAVAGFLERREGTRIGVFAGVFAAIPLFLLLLLFGGALTVIPIPHGGVESIVVVVLLVVFFLLLYVVVLSAVGGVVGVYLGEEFLDRRERDTEQTDR
jgi:cell division protein FtsL